MIGIGSLPPSLPIDPLTYFYPQGERGRVGGEDELYAHLQGIGKGSKPVVRLGQMQWESYRSPPTITYPP